MGKGKDAGRYIVCDMIIKAIGLKIFQYTDKEVRTVIIDNEPWWGLKDVCSILDITNTTDVANRLDEDERARFNQGRPWRRFPRF